MFLRSPIIALLHVGGVESLKVMIK